MTSIIIFGIVGILVVYASAYYDKPSNKRHYSDLVNCYEL